MGKAKLLVVDDEELIRWSLKKNLEQYNYEVFTASSGEEALEIIKEEMPDLVIQDMKLPGVSGLELLEKMKKLHQSSQVIMMTAYGDPDTSVKAMELGVYDFIEKPFDFEKLRLTVKNALDAVPLKKEGPVVQTGEKGPFGLEYVVGQTGAMQAVFQMAETISQSDAAIVLLQGESGTGKDVISKAIHYGSRRAENPYIEFSCASLSEALLERELFGRENEASPGTGALKKGLLELADGGTIVLDEIENMPMSIQAKLCEVIGKKSFRRLGRVKEIVVDVRIIAATKMDLTETSGNGAFCKDLYDCLKAFPIYLPPLRERKEDIPVLAEYFIGLFNARFKKKVQGLDPEALDRIMQYAWPGNVRELKHVMERAVLLAGRERILAGHLPPEVCMPGKDSGAQGDGIKLPPQGISMDEVERELIRQALDRAGQNQVHAARLLKVSRDTLRYRMKKYDLL